MPSTMLCASFVIKTCNYTNNNNNNDYDNDNDNDNFLNRIIIISLLKYFK